MTISRESYEDVQPKASVAANTGAGPDLFWGLYSLPHLFPQKCIDVADYLGKKYGGWVDSAVKYGKSGPKWIAVGDIYRWGSLMAGAMIGSLPLVVLYAFFVEHYVSAMTGAVKE